MKVFKLIVDKKPEWCLFCPLRGSSIKVDIPACGKSQTVDVGGGWTQGGMAPDEMCIIEEAHPVKLNR